MARVSCGIRKHSKVINVQAFGEPRGLITALFSSTSFVCAFVFFFCCVRPLPIIVRLTFRSLARSDTLSLYPPHFANTFMCFCTAEGPFFCEHSFHLPYSHVEFIQLPRPAVLLSSTHGWLFHTRTSLRATKTFLWKFIRKEWAYKLPPFPSHRSELVRKDLVHLYLIKTDSVTLTAIVFYSMVTVAFSAVTVIAFACIIIFVSS